MDSFWQLYNPEPVSTLLFMKEPLASEEQQIWKELVQLAGGMGCSKQLRYLNEQQERVIISLKSKGYVAMSKRTYIVILRP